MWHSISLFSDTSVVYNLGILGHFGSNGIFGLGSSRTFGAQNLEKKNCQNSQRFWTI